MPDRPWSARSAHRKAYRRLTAVQSLMRVGGLNMKGVFTRTRTPKLAVRVLREFWA